jgi:sugar phosphate isomerase/epimerase
MRAGPIISPIRDVGKEDLPCLKGCLPFRLSTTSYILPAPILPNLKFLAPYVDEVELVLFQSGEEQNLPSKKEIREMAGLAVDLELTYNVHLPTDVFLADPDPKVRAGSVETLLRFHERTFSLAPTLYVLHLETRSANGERITDQTAWADRTGSCLEELWRGGVEARMLAVENLDYAPSWLMETFRGEGMWCCVDVGHLVRYGIPVEEELDRCMERCRMVHLHGVQDGVDHQALDLLPEALWENLRARLEGLRGGLSIEVFSLENLARSLQRISQWVTS